MEVTKIEAGRIRFCAFETYDGLRRHYICGHHEYCCALGCCVSTAFSFYQLWYFWLLLLLIILICSGGGWWFRWRHGAFNNTRTPTPVHHRRHPRIGRPHGPRAPRVYPHPHYFSGPGFDKYTLPPGYDKDPPSYNEVIAHLSQFPPVSVPRPEDAVLGHVGSSSTFPMCDDPQLSMPPPSYEMVLDLKRKEIQLETEIAQEEQRENEETTRGRIQSILGRTRRTTSDQNEPSSSGSYSNHESSPSTSSSGLFTISSESLPSVEYYERATASTGRRHSSVASQLTTSPSSSELSHSDYSSNFHPSSSSAPSSCSSSSRSGSMSSGDAPPSYYATVPPQVDVTPVENEESQGEALGLAARPTTGRSVLSRPATSISTRSLPPPPQMQRKTSLPGALIESEDEEEEEEEKEDVEQPSTP